VEPKELRLYVSSLFPPFLKKLLRERYIKINKNWDKNGCKNIQKVFKSYMETGKRPEKYRRENTQLNKSFQPLFNKAVKCETSPKFSLRTIKRK